MLYQLLKYCNVRLTAALFLFIFFFYPTLFLCTRILFVNPEANYSILFGVLIVSAILPLGIDFLGSRRFNSLLNKLDRQDISKGIFSQIRQYERLVRMASSFYFFPTRGKRLSQEAYERYASFYLKLNVQTEEAGDVLEQAYVSMSGNQKFRESLIEIFSRQDSLNNRELEIAKKIALDDMENTKAVNLALKTLLDKKLFHMETESLFLKAVQKDMPLSGQVFDFVLPILLDSERHDDFAAEFYLNACYKYGFKDHRLVFAMDRLSTEFLVSGRNDILAKEIYEVIQSLPKDKETLNEEFALERKENEAAKGCAWFINRCSTFIKPAILSLAGKTRTSFFQITGAIKERVKNNLYPWVRAKLQAWYSTINTWLQKLSEYYFRTPRKTRKKAVYFLIVLLVLIPAIFAAITIIPRKGPSALISQQLEKEYVPYSSAKKFTIQVAAFKTKGESKPFMEQLINSGESPYWIEDPGKTYRIKIRVGHFDSKKEAKSYANTLVAQDKIIDYFVANFERGFIYQGLEKNIKSGE